MIGSNFCVFFILIGQSVPGYYFIGLHLLCLGPKTGEYISEKKIHRPVTVIGFKLLIFKWLNLKGWSRYWK